MVEAVGKLGMETFKRYGVYEKKPIKECWEMAGKAPIGVKWVDANKGDKKNPEYRSRLVAKEIKRAKREDSFAASPPLKAKKVLVSWRDELRLHCRGESVFPFAIQERRMRVSTSRRRTRKKHARSA